MATREELLLAREVIKKLNLVIENLRDFRSSQAATMTKIQAVIDDPTEQQKLLNGLAEYGIDVADVNSEKTTVNDILDHIETNRPPTVKF